MSSPQKKRATALYSARVDKTITTLQERVKEQEALLAELRASATTTLDSNPSENPKTLILQLRALKAVYEDLTPSKPWLPSSDSPLPALLALRATTNCIKETQECIVQTQADLQAIQQRLSKEAAFVEEAKLIQTNLKARISSLQVEIDDRTQKPPSQVAKEMKHDLEAKQDYYNEETGKLVQAFNLFIDNHLAPLLAAEELGGPIVGDNLGVDEEMIEAGFNAQGKPKKLKPNPNPDHHKRQRRIDQIWGARSGNDDMEVDEKPWGEKRAAGAEMRELTEQLLNSLVEAGGTGPGAYVELSRESAAARFLVRSKVAQFHPRDARKLRLVDFGGEVED